MAALQLLAQMAPLHEALDLIGLLRFARASRSTSTQSGLQELLRHVERLPVACGHALAASHCGLPLSLQIAVAARLLWMQAGRRLAALTGLELRCVCLTQTALARTHFSGLGWLRDGSDSAIARLAGLGDHREVPWHEEALAELGDLDLLGALDHLNYDPELRIATNLLRAGDGQWVYRWFRAGSIDEDDVCILEFQVFKLCGAVIFEELILN